MSVIWKFALHDSGINEIEAPSGTVFISAQVQHGRVTVWGACRPENPMAVRRIAAVETGATIPFDAWRPLGTLQFMQGHYTVHVIEEVEGAA